MPEWSNQLYISIYCIDNHYKLCFISAQGTNNEKQNILIPPLMQLMSRFLEQVSCLKLLNDYGNDSMK